MIPSVSYCAGECVDLASGADFYVAEEVGLKRERGISLQVYLENCQKLGIAVQGIFR